MVNENVPNLIPSVTLVAGAGGVSVDFSGNPLLARPLAAGRTSVVHAANDPPRARALEIVGNARSRAGDDFSPPPSGAYSASRPPPRHFGVDRAWANGVSECPMRRRGVVAVVGQYAVLLLGLAVVAGCGPKCVKRP